MISNDHHRNAYLRLLETCAGVPKRKICMRSVFHRNIRKLYIAVKQINRNRRGSALPTELSSLLAAGSYCEFVMYPRVRNCAFLVANATKNFALATRISQLVASGRLTISCHDNYTNNNFDFQPNRLK